MKRRGFMGMAMAVAVAVKVKLDVPTAEAVGGVDEPTMWVKWVDYGGVCHVQDTVYYQDGLTKEQFDSNKRYFDGYRTVGDDELPPMGGWIKGEGE